MATKKYPITKPGLIVPKPISKKKIVKYYKGLLKSILGAPEADKLVKKVAKIVAKLAKLNKKLVKIEKMIKALERLISSDYKNAIYTAIKLY